MLIYKINFSLLTLFFLLIYIYKLENSWTAKQLEMRHVMEMNDSEFSCSFQC